LTKKVIVHLFELVYYGIDDVFVFVKGCSVVIKLINEVLWRDF